MNHSLRLGAALVLLLIAVRPSYGVVVYTELDNGELSGESTAPTDLGLFMPGSNTVTGRVESIGEEGFNGTADVFTFEIGVGMQWDSLILLSYSTTDGDASFFALDDGEMFEFTAPEINDRFNLPDLANSDTMDGRGGILGAGIFGVPEIGQELLDNPDPLAIDLADSSRFGYGEGFSGPLGPGRYSMYIQETMDTSNYSLAFGVSTATGVPEASHFAALTAASLGYLFTRRRRKRRAQSKEFI